jgi:glycosyltransferase involved in cell wall biosynthesis
MRDKNKIIVFMKAYNSSKTLSRAIESVLNQTHTNFTFFILNNGSKDNTNNIIMDYFNKDERVIPLALKHNDITNGGVIERTIYNCTDAKWYCQLDADDWYENNFFEDSIKLGNEYNLDFVCGGYRKIFDETDEIIKEKFITESLVLKREDYADKFVTYRGFLSYFWGKMFNIDILNMDHFRKNIGVQKGLPPQTVEYQTRDSKTVLSICRKSNSFGILPGIYYNYYISKNNYSNQMYENILSKWNSFMYLQERTESYIHSLGEISKRNSEFLMCIYISFIEEVIDSIKQSPKKLTEADRFALLYKIFTNDNTNKILNYKWSRRSEFKNGRNFKKTLKALVDLLGVNDNYKAFVMIGDEFCVN